MCTPRTPFAPLPFALSFDAEPVPSLSSQSRISCCTSWLFIASMSLSSASYLLWLVARGAGAASWWRTQAQHRGARRGGQRLEADSGKATGGGEEGGGHWVAVIAV